MRMGIGSREIHTAAAGTRRAGMISDAVTRSMKCAISPMSHINYLLRDRHTKPRHDTHPKCTRNAPRDTCPGDHPMVQHGNKHGLPRASPAAPLRTRSGGAHARDIQIRRYPARLQERTNTCAPGWQRRKARNVTRARNEAQTRSDQARRTSTPMTPEHENDLPLRPGMAPGPVPSETAVRRAEMARPPVGLLVGAECLKTR